MPLQLTGLDIYRDGGSHSASFRNADDLDCTLFFQIFGASFGSTPRTFKTPRLQEQVPRSLTSPITGATDHFTEQREREISWQDALAILRELEPQLSNFKTSYAQVFPVMLSAAQNQGISGADE